MSSGNLTTRISLDNDKIYFLDNYVAQIYDVSDPASPSLINTVSAPNSGQFSSIAVEGGILVAGDDINLKVVAVDVGNPLSPTVIDDGWMSYYGTGMLFDDGIILDFQDTMVLDLWKLE